MESKQKKPFNNYDFHFYRYNSTKVKPNLNNDNNNVNKELNNQKKEEMNNNTFKTPILSNELKNNDNYNNKDNIINIVKKEDNNQINPVQEEIKKLKLENEELRKISEKRAHLINDLKARCNEQKLLMTEMLKKVEEIKNFIPENTYRKDKTMRNEKLEEQLVIAAVEEQIIKDLYHNNSNDATMDKIFSGENNNKENNNVKEKIKNIPQIFYQKNKFENFECSICIDEFKDNELLKQLKCGHIFHRECLGQWLLNMNNCPICKRLC